MSIPEPGLFGTAATVCLPSRGRGRVFRRNDKAPPPVRLDLDAPTAGSPTGLACGVTGHFSLFVESLVQQDWIAKAWLARLGLGRTLAQHVTDAVLDRPGAPRAAGLPGRFAGQPLPVPGSALPGLADTRPPLLNPDGGIAGMGDGPDAQSRTLTARRADREPILVDRRGYRRVVRRGLARHVVDRAGRLHLQLGPAL